MIHAYPLRRGAALLLAALLLTLAPAAPDVAPRAAGDGARPVTDGGAEHELVWRSCGVRKNKKKAPAKLTPTSNGKERNFKSGRGGNRADSNPTTVPIVDTDFLFSVYGTHEQLATARAQRVTRGAGMVVAVLDGGFNLRHPDIEPNLHPMSYDAIDDDYDAQDLGNGFDDDLDGRPDDGVGHGTFVSGMVLSVAPDVTILPIRVRDDEGWGTNKELERGLVMAFALGAHVINISGEAAHGRSVHIARWIAYFHAAGVLVVNSAGNGGLGEVSELGDANTTLIVGAVDAEDRLAPFSNNTVEPGRFFVLAPGVDLYGPYGAGFDASHAYWSGTSFSAGLVSGGAALMRALEPSWSAAELMEWITHAVDPVVDGDGYLLPYGRIDLGKAVTR